MALTIRDAKSSDAPDLAELMNQLGYNTTSGQMKARLNSVLSDPRYRTFVAIIDGKICGMIGTLTHHSPEHDDLSGKIVALVVSEQHRRRGVGSALIAAAEKDFAKRKVLRVTLTTRFEREVAHRFYETRGYAKTGFRFGKKLASLLEHRRNQ